MVPVIFRRMFGMSQDTELAPNQPKVHNELTEYTLAQYHAISYHVRPFAPARFLWFEPQNTAQATTNHSDANYPEHTRVGPTLSRSA